MKGSEYIAKSWLAYGVEAIFLVPTNLFDSLVALERTGVRRILTHGEKAAGYMADGYAQAAGRPGIVVTQGGPGATNLAAGLAEPWQASSPVIAFNGGSLGGAGVQERVPGCPRPLRERHEVQRRCAPQRAPGGPDSPGLPRGDIG